MKADVLRDRIKVIVRDVYKDKIKADDAALAYPVLKKFPELKDVIIDLLSSEFDAFLESIDWVAPKPSTFRVNLLNGQNFMLTYSPRSWIAQVEGKKYYLLNLDEEEYCTQAVARILQYGPESGAEVEGDMDADMDTDTDTGSEEIDVNVDVEDDA